MSRFARSESRYADTLAWIASRTAGSMSSTRSGTEKKKLTDTYAPLPAAKAEVDGDRDSLACAAIRAHPVRKPAREHDAHARPRREPLCLAEGHAVRAGERQIRRVHDRGHTARILDLELAAERRIGANAAVIDIISSGPERAGMGVELVAMAKPVDVGPAVDPPGELVPLASAVDSDLVGDGPRKAEHLL